MLFFHYSFNIDFLSLKIIHKHISCKHTCNLVSIESLLLFQKHIQYPIKETCVRGACFNIFSVKAPLQMLDKVLKTPLQKRICNFKTGIPRKSKNLTVFSLKILYKFLRRLKRITAVSSFSLYVSLSISTTFRTHNLEHVAKYGICSIKY